MVSAMTCESIQLTALTMSAHYSLNIKRVCTQMDAVRVGKQTPPPLFFLAGLKSVILKNGF